jgi:preprotein translocase subunit SecD
LAGTWQIDVDMNKVQSAAFDRMARRDLHKMVATVVEGVAPMEPIIQVPTFFGKFAIVGPFTKRSAEHIALELEPT